ncbi:MAG TPA: hypothetical protein VKU90_06050 [Caulobacteraceae bacterium]|nr:hypothetical protein [Caulobacteraceae bacterium]
MMRPIAIALALLSLAAPGAALADPPTPLQLPTLRAGPTMRFAAESQIMGNAAANAVGARRWAFDVQVLDAGRVVYTLRSVELSGVYASGQSFLDAMKDVPVIFTVTPEGRPTGIDNWDAVAARAAPAVSANERALFDSAPEAAKNSVTNAVTESVLYVIADAQPRTPIAPGHTVLFSDKRVLPDVVASRSIDLDGVDTASCQAELRLSGSAVAGRDGRVFSRQTIEAHARVSTRDGWVTTFDQTQVEDAGPRTTLSVRRLSTPGC